MNWIFVNIKWIMLVSGVLTLTMIFPLIAPHAALVATFGDDLPTHPLTEIIVRNWGALITLVGGMLIYGAYHPMNRSFILAVAGISKLVFISLVMIFGSQYLGKAGVAVVFDAIVVVLYFVYLVGIRQK